MSDTNILKQRYEIAGIRLVMTTYYDRTASQAKEYIARGDWSEEEADECIDFGVDFYKERLENSIYNSDLETIEYIYTGAMFNRYILKYNGCMLHSSAVVVDGYAYLFSADSGTGKSTHTNLWIKHFGDKAFIINDDKPCIRKIDDEWYVFGTPWSGKTDTNINTSVKLGAIVFLERSSENWIEEESIKNAISKFFKQTVRKLSKEENMDLVLSNMEQILQETPLYRMGCNISDEAVATAYNKIRRV